LQEDDNVFHFIRELKLISVVQWTYLDFVLMAEGGLICCPMFLQLMRMDRSIIEGLQDIVSLLEDQLKPLVQSELSLLVDILYRPELLFPPGTEARKRCESGGFIRR
jgi:hypothetical protein